MIIDNNEDIILDTRDECGLSFQKIHTTLNNEISWYPVIMKLFYIRLSFHFLPKLIEANICEIILIAQVIYDKAQVSAILCWKSDNKAISSTPYHGISRTYLYLFVLSFLLLCISSHSFHVTEIWCSWFTI